MDTMYKYLKVNVSGKKEEEGIVCIQIDRPPLNESDLKYSISYSFCSPTDRGKFSKTKGRSIMNCRMNNGYCVSFSSTERLSSKILISKARELLKNDYIEGVKASIKVPRWLSRSNI